MSEHAFEFGAALPVGAVIQWAGANDPVDPDEEVRWHICDGRSGYSSTSHPGLHAVLAPDFSFGGADSDFNIPDLRQRIPLGQKQPTSTSLREDQISSTGDTLGGAGGAVDHVHTTTISVPRLTATINLPNLSIPSLTVNIPSLTVNQHFHTLAGNGGACVRADGGGVSFGSGLSIYGYSQGPLFTDNGYAYFTGSGAGDAGPPGAAASHHSYPLTGRSEGTTDTVTTIASSGSTNASATDSGGPQGTGSLDPGQSMGGTSSTNNPPFLTLNYVIKIK